MPVEAQIEAFITASNAIYRTGVDDSVDDQRAVYDELCRHYSPPHPGSLHNHYASIDGVPVRWYWSDNCHDGCIVYLHGGGFVVGGLGWRPQ